MSATADDGGADLKSVVWSCILCDSYERFAFMAFGWGCQLWHPQQMVNWKTEREVMRVSASPLPWTDRILWVVALVFLFRVSQHLSNTYFVPAWWLLEDLFFLCAEWEDTRSNWLPWKTDSKRCFLKWAVRWCILITHSFLPTFLLDIFMENI